MSLIFDKSALILNELHTATDYVVGPWKTYLACRRRTILVIARYWLVTHDRTADAMVSTEFTGPSYLKNHGYTR